MKRQNFLLLGLSTAILAVMLFSMTKLWVEKSAKALLGGDVEISRENRIADLGVNAYLGVNSRAISHVMTMRAEAQPLRKGESNNPIPVLVKAFQQPYPLYGKFSVDQKKRKRALSWFPKANANGAAVSRASLTKMGLDLDGTFTIGKHRFIVSMLITSEPDAPRETEEDSPRIIVSPRVFEELKENRPINIPVIHSYRAKILARGDVATWRKNFEDMFPQRGWIVRDWRDNAPWIFYAISWKMIAIVAVILFGLMLRALPSRSSHG